jgi:hypothetical protein
MGKEEACGVMVWQKKKIGQGIFIQDPNKTAGVTTG